MSLAYAIQKNSQSLAEAHRAYHDNIVRVCQAMLSVMQSDLPKLKNTPGDWEAYETALAAAKADARLWHRNVLVRLLTIPDEVESYKDDISELLFSAWGMASTLVQLPDNDFSSTMLAQDLSQVSERLDLVSKSIGGAVEALTRFSIKLPDGRPGQLTDMRAQLQSIADRAALDENADQTAIDQLKEHIAQLRDDVDHLSSIIEALKAERDAAKAAPDTARDAFSGLGFVGDILGSIGAGVTTVVFTPVVIVSDFVIELNEEKVMEDKAKIEADLQKLSDRDADVALLHALAQNYGILASEVQALHTNVDAVMQEWQTLQGDVDSAVKDINTAISTEWASKPDYQAILDDINQAMTEWQNASEQADTLCIKLQVNTAPLKIGMSSDDIKAALATGQSMDIMAYLHTLPDSQAA